ncbi:ribosome biogenesis GTP-binding protein YihA/YsxC [Candidatus Bodocaedibacter vickermanii]|uniref:Probable GTP-binding protein EngB n=1 Tax=Candidatus Bodocaedibacter vickermanii TaxID=2741701 RepID=A0A7L9RV51_9PROT|nr:putative GTP-binding protein EngB [Candidatus Paracaedibacteraceae bacterium 'Lake Konstanz']
MTPSFSSIKSADILFRQECEFRFGVDTLDRLPPMTVPEFGFIGRSNVGKSSLINALVNRTIARTSNTPGRTQQLNFFSLAEACYIVDMPGYGYAKVSKTKIAAWNGLMKDYLVGRSVLQHVFLLLDSRHEIKPADDEMMTMLDESAVPYQLVLTKVDKLKPNELTRAVESMKAVIQRHVAAHPELIVTSAVDKEGIIELRRRVYKLLLESRDR